jgi:tetratricopeptide (TPR) repeat protein
MVATFTACTNAQQSKPGTATMPVTETNAKPAKLGEVGTVNFSTSCSEDAQVHFLRGVAALHSFWYPVAIDEFRESTRIDPDCMMGYWGEAMAHDHPIWGDPQETEAARKVLTKIRITPELTPRERAYLNAVKVLYGEGDEAARDEAYSAVMAKIYRDYPDDEDAALFYALSLMGTIQPGDPDGLQTRLRAGEIAAEVYKKNPNHPGAAHYVIHAYDDPENAIKALDAARRYAKIAPAAPHALHMPSHIFLQLGMWSEAAASNEAAWAAANIQEKPQDRSVNASDLEGFHSLHWLNYIYLQQGRYNKAGDLLTRMRQELAASSPNNPIQLYYAAYTYAHMAAAYVVETERWDLADELFQPLQALAEAGATGQAQPQQPQNAAIQAALVSLQTLPKFVRGLAAAQQGSADADQSIAQLQAIAQQYSGTQEPALAQALKRLEIQRLEIAAANSAAKGDFKGAIATMKQATALEASLSPPLGPPELIKPSHELFGEILLQAKRPKEAAEQFATSLRRHENRAHSLLGIARAAVQNGNTQVATNTYTQLTQQWQQADAQLPELREAQDYLNRVGAR